MVFPRARSVALVAAATLLVPAGEAARPLAVRHVALDPEVTPSERFSWPVDPHVVLRVFDAPDVKWGSGHRGVDLEASSGTAVTAPAEGEVTFVGMVAGRPVLTLRHREGFDTTYEPIAAQVKRGDSVKRGQVLGTIASGGHCDARCLHWGYRVQKDVYRDPLTLIRGVRPVLLPPL